MAPRVRLVFEKTKGNAAALQRSALIFILSLPFCASENYTIVGVSIGPPASSVSDFKPTFENYLSQQVSQTLGRQIFFNLKGVSVNADKDTIFDMIEGSRVDFVYSAPYILGCLESEFEIQPLATVRKRYVIGGKEYILNR